MEGGEAMSDSEGAIRAGHAMAVTGNASLDAALESGGNMKPRKTDNKNIPSTPTHLPVQPRLQSPSSFDEGCRRRAAMPEPETSSSGQSGGFVRSISGGRGTLELKPAANKTPGSELGARHTPVPRPQSLFAKPTTRLQTPGKVHSDSKQVSAYAPAKFIVAVLS